MRKFFLLVGLFTFVGSGAAQATSYGADLYRYYKLDETSGALEIVDATGNYNGAVGDSDVNLGISGVYGTAIGFAGNSDGTRDTIGLNPFDDNYPSSAAMDNFAFGAWIRTNDSHHIDVEGSGFDNNASGQVWAFGGAWSYPIDNIGSAKLSVGTNGVSVFETAASYLHPRLVHEETLGTGWHHISVVYENRQPTLYIDGNFARTGLTSDRSHVIMPSELGGTVWRDLNGAVDEVFVTTRSLSAGEVQNIFSQGVEAVFAQPIPEPSTALLLGIGLAGLGMRRRTHRRGCS